MYYFLIKRVISLSNKQAELVKTNICFIYCSRQRIEYLVFRRNDTIGEGGGGEKQVVLQFCPLRKVGRPVKM
jgi:hypothetical protein